MSGDGTHPLEGDFPLPELKAIGDSVCEMLQFGVEEDLLGTKILNRLQGPLATGRVTTADVVRLALCADTLLVAEEAIGADARVSDAEARYALPLVQQSAQRLAPFRHYYATLDHVGPAELAGFINAHRRDTQLFGGACPATRWLGLEIVCRLVQETGDREPLDRYSELMLRLVEEIAALEGGSASPEQVRDEIEVRLGLRKRLAQAQAEAPQAQEDPRARAFCSPNAAEVFHAIAHANQIWKRDPFDVESVHEATRSVFARLLARAAEQNDHDTGRVLLILGEAGSGKTHLMRAFREAVHAGRNGYVGYLQMSAATDDYARFFAAHLIESLEKPYDEPVVPQSGLMCLSDALLAGAGLDDKTRARLREPELSDEQVCELVFHAADALLADARFAGIDIDLIRALLFLQRREPRLHARVLKFLRCEALSAYDLALLGELAPKTRAEDALRLIADLGKLIARLEGGALVLMLDQLEDIYNLSDAKPRFVRAMDVVRHITDNVPNGLVIVSCLRDYYLELKESLTASVVDRIERDPKPQQLHDVRTLPEIEAMLARRLRHLFESAGTRYRVDEPYFPYSHAALERLTGLRTREVLEQLRGFQEQCIASGNLVDVPADPTLVTAVRQASVAPSPPLELVIERQWREFKDANALQAPDADEALEALLDWALRAASDEVFATAAWRAEAGAGGLVVYSASSSDTVPRALLVRVANRSTRGGGLANQISDLLQAAKTHAQLPIAVRSSEFGGGAKTGQQIAQLLRAGGRRVVVENAEWRGMATYRAFRSHLAAAPSELAAFLQREQPLLRFDAIRTILGLADSISGPIDAARVSKKPPSIAPSAAPLEPAPVASSSAPPTAVGPLRIGATLSIKAEPALLDQEQLKRHAAFLGASGSGKTSLALNVIEQLIARGIPAILLDRKGDLAGYADPEQQARSLPNAEREARRQRLFARAHVRLFTPGDPHGRSLRIRIVPAGISSLPAHERAQIARFAAQGLGAMMGYSGKAAEQTLLAILAKAIEVLGQIGSNEELGLRQLIDLLYEEDASLVAELGYLDTKHFKKLVEHLETLRLNHGALLESNDEPLSAAMLLGAGGDVPKGKVPLTIVSTKFLGDAARVEFWVSQMLVDLSRWSSRSPASKLQAALFLDEADAYMPASSKPATKEPLQDLLKRARSAGLSVLLATQNPGDLDYKGRDTIGTWWLGRIASQPAIAKMKPLLSECRTDISAALATSGIGEFYQVYDGQAVRIRAERSLLETVQLPEERILSLAAATRGPQGATVEAKRPVKITEPAES